MPDANLYLDKIDLAAYLTGAECKKCGAQSCRQLVESLKTGACRPEELSPLPRGRLAALEAVLSAERLLPPVPSLQMPRPVATGLVELNEPAAGDPVLITGNSQFTQEVLLAVLAATRSPFFVLFTDTRGDTLDMAVILESFTPERVQDSLEAERLSSRAASSTLVIPGLAASLEQGIRTLSGWPVEVGPVCAAELPLYFGDRWIA